jgi:serine/threonine-protein kinase
MTDASTPARDATDATADALRRAVAGEFRLEREIGRGGMGVVYCALDLQLQREVAIKTLPPHLAADSQVRNRFLREARTAAALSHPNIVPIYSAAERDGVVFFAMGFVDGESLAERIAKTGPLSPRELVVVLRELADALGYAHARGVVHRDVKAENVLIDRATGRALVTDFGIARVAETQPLTATGTVLGTVHYMSPEQVSGDPLDGRSDLYALGVLSFFALTGRFPFERATASAVVVAQVNAAPPRLRELLPSAAPALETLVATLLAKSPAGRYADAGALRAALDDPSLLSHPAPLPVTDTPNLSSTEAQQVWSRAAELQANTGMIAPAPAFTPRGDSAPVTSGYDMALVKQSAVEAGIDGKYVDRAMLERAAAAPLAIERGEIMSKRPNFILGAPTKLEYTAGFDGELDNDAFEEIADEVRKVLGEMTAVSAVGRTLTVTTGMPSARQGGMPRFVQVYLTSRHGRTEIRVFEDLSQLAGGLFGGLGAGGGVGGGALVAGVLAGATHSPPLVIAGLASTVGAMLLLARVLFRRSERKKEAELQALLQRVIARARRSMLMTNERKQLPPSGR